MRNSTLRGRLCGRTPSMLRNSLLIALTFASGFALADNKRPPRTYHLSHVSWSISFDETAQTISGDVTNTIAPLADGLAVAEFDCVKLQVSKAMVDGHDATFHQTEDKLDVDLPKTGKGRQRRIRILYTGHPEAGVYFVRADRAYPAHTPMVYTQGEMEDTRYWLPTYDYPDDKATFESFIEVPAGYNTLSNGRLVEIRDKGDRRTFHWKLDQPASTYLMSFVVGPYTERSDNWGSLPVSFYVPTGLEPEGEAAFGGTAKIVEFYSRLTGFKYPYAKFAQAAVADFPFGGMENITCVTQTINTLHPESDGVLSDSTGLVAHELAHQWFGDTVTTADWSNIWLNEGWATFLPNFWTRDKEGKEAYEVSKYETFEGGLGACRFASRPMVFTDYKEPIDMFDGNAYPGGASRMFMLMHKLGESKFWRAITDYLNAYKYKNATTDEFFASIEKSTHENLEAFKQQWFFTADKPFLTVKREGTKLTIEQPTEMALDLDLLFVGDKPVTKSISITGKSTTIDVPEANGEPFLLDPGCNEMVDVDYQTQYSGDEWRALYDHAPSAGTKMRIVGAAMRAMNDEQKLAMLKSETSPFLLPRIIELGNFTTVILAPYTEKQDPRVENAALVALGSQPKSDLSIARLRAVYNSSPNENLRFSALVALLNLTGDDVVAQSAWRTNTFHQRLRDYALQWWGAHKPDYAREIALKALENPPNESVRLAAMNVLATVKDKPGETRVYDALVKVLGENDFNPRRAAIAALGDYGNPAAIPLIEPLTHRSMHFMRGMARATIARLARK